MYVASYVVCVWIKKWRWVSYHPVDNYYTEEFGYLGIGAHNQLLSAYQLLGA